MEFKIKVGTNEEVQVDYLEFGIDTQGRTEGWADVYIRVRDDEADIYTEEPKKFWIEWLNNNFGEKDNPEERVQSVEAKIYSDQNVVYRSITIEEAYLAGYTEYAMGAKYSYSALIKRAPTRKGDIIIRAA